MNDEKIIIEIISKVILIITLLIISKVIHGVKSMTLFNLTTVLYWICRSKEETLRRNFVYQDS